MLSETDARDYAADLIHDHARTASWEAIKAHLVDREGTATDDDAERIAELIASATVTVEWEEGES